MRNIIAIGIVIAVVLFLKKRFGTNNDLQSELKEQRELKQIGNVATASGNASLPPLTTVGDTPLAGIHLDPFLPDSIAARVKDFAWNPVGSWAMTPNTYRN
jgi:hypothetical protein